MIEKIKQFIRVIKENQNDIILVIGIILISLISFGAGKLTSTQIQNSENQPPAIIENSNRPSGTITPTPEAIKIQIIGNKNSKIYHYPWCSGAKNMKEENKIYFNSKEEAEKAGYKPAGNCPGLLNP